MKLWIPILIFLLFLPFSATLGEIRRHAFFKNVGTKTPSYRGVSIVELEQLKEQMGSMSLAKPQQKQLAPATERSSMENPIQVVSTGIRHCRLRQKVVAAKKDQYR